MMKLRKDIGAEAYNIHAIRHTVASEIGASGSDDEVMTITGHTTTGMVRHYARKAGQKALPLVMSDALTATFKKGTSSPTADFIGPDLQVSLFLSTNESSENRLVWKESIMEIAAWCGPAHRKETIEALEAAAKYLRDAEDYESTHS